jgi:hypothetical protein
LALWAGELSNIALAAFATVTLLIRTPFPLAYEEDATPRGHWDEPLFRRINYMISAYVQPRSSCRRSSALMGRLFPSETEATEPQ